MNKAHRILIVSLAVFVFIPAIVGAVIIENPLTYDSFGELLRAIVWFLMLLAIPITVIIIVVSGYYFVASKGDPEKFKIARRMVIYALIGLIIILSAWAMIGVIEYIFNINIPR